VEKQGHIDPLSPELRKTMNLGGKEAHPFRAFLMEKGFLLSTE
jgi:hypothetical protein